MTLGLIACGKAKLKRPAPARELYTGTPFRLARDLAERSFTRWAILSAKHGLVFPFEVLEPYEQALGDSSKSEREAWGERVAQQIESITSEGERIVALVPSAYEVVWGDRLRV